MSHDVKEIVKRRKMSMYSTMTKAARIEALKNMTYPEIFVMRRTYELFLTRNSLSGFFTSGPKGNWEVSLNTIENTLLDPDFGITDKDGFVSGLVDIPSDIILYEVLAEAKDDSCFDALTNIKSEIGEKISAIVKKGDQLFYASELSTIFANGLKSLRDIQLNSRKSHNS